MQHREDRHRRVGTVKPKMQTSGGRFHVSFRQLGAEVAPFPVGNVEGPLRQNTGRQAAMFTVVREAHAEYDAHLGKAEQGRDWKGLLSRVEQTVRIMPLWKLQTVGSERVEFLYENREGDNPREILLKPGVSCCFRQFYSLVIEMVEGA
jgi:hypothetical protein